MAAPKVLTVEALVRAGKARSVQGGYLISPEGQAELRANQDARSLYFRDHPEERREEVRAALLRQPEVKEKRR